MRSHIEPCGAAVSSWLEDREQVVIDECYAVAAPTTVDGIARFVAGNIDGIGPQLAERIVRALGATTVAQVNADPALLEQILPGKRGRDAASHWRRWRVRWEDQQKAYDLALRLTSRGLSYRHARRILSFFRSADVAEIVLLRRPYRLLDVPGFRWPTADKLARQIGVARDAPERLSAAVVAALEAAAADDGHSCLRLDELARRATSRAGTMALACTGAAAAVESGVVAEDDGDYYLPRALDAEWRVGRHLRRRAAMRHPLAGGDAARVDAEIARAGLSVAQSDAVRQSLTSGAFLLTGGPGTGKTWTLRTIVACASVLGMRLKVVAPTGKAAARATAVTKAPAETVHRLIGGPPGSERRTPLDLDLVIVDETSMVSVELMAWLLDNVRPATRVICCGDPDQLPSVDHGAVLRDLLAAASIPTVRLREVFRQGRESGIVRNAYRILAGEALKSTSDFLLLDATDRRGVGREPDAAWEKETARKLLAEQLTRMSAAGSRLVTDVQVLTPMRKSANRLGARSLNELIRHAVNGDDPRAPRPGCTSAERSG